VRIGELLDSMTSAREEAKAAHLASLLDTHALVLAFDRSLITLEVLRSHLDAISGTEIILATGRAGREQLAEAMALDSSVRRTVGLCSDAMAEGMNLQAASAVVHLDLPSVIRIAEQRIGRVDRMDSPHSAIEVWWPDDSLEFALRSDERLVERHFDVKTLLGANIRLPAKFEPVAADTTTISAADVVEELQNRARRRDRAWEELPDALEPIRSLVLGPVPARGVVRASSLAL
jgi:superfamily II DNA/RNA helicase